MYILYVHFSFYFALLLIIIKVKNYFFYLDKIECWQ